MEHRKASYKAPPRSDQAKRRLDALLAQRERRSDALAAVRGIDDLEGFSFDGSDSSDEDESRFEDAPPPHFPAAAPGRSPSAPQPSLSASLTSEQRKEKKAQRISKKYRRYADRCMYAEQLDLSDPELWNELETEYIAVGPVPKGKRCLVLTHTISRPRGKRRTATNTLLVSRVSAKPLGRFLTVLPPDCILDCILSSSAPTVNGMSDQAPVLCVLDVLQWKSQRYVDCEAEFRFFWRDTKLSELPTQTWPPLPAPNLFVASVPAGPATFERLASTASALLASDRSALPASSIPLVADGLLLYVKGATYEAGPTVLAGWVPLEGEDGERSAMTQLAEQCRNAKQVMQE